MTAQWEILQGDCMVILPRIEPSTVQTCVTSPPYWGLRDYGHVAQIGLEDTLNEYVAKMVDVFRSVRRVLRDDGTLWLNLGDSYAGGKSRNCEGFNERWHGKSYLSDKQGDTERERPERRPVEGLKAKDLVGIPWRLAFALQADGWYLRSDIIWAKPNPMPESVTDRPTKAHEYLFLLAKSERYFYDAEAIREVAHDWGSRDRTNWKARNPSHNPSKPHTGGERGDFSMRGRNRRTVWTIPSQPFPGAHFAVMPPALVEPCVLAGSAKGDLILDPFAGSGTVGVVCRKHERRFVGVELNPEYARMARGRLGADPTLDAPKSEMPLFRRGENP